MVRSVITGMVIYEEFVLSLFVHIRHDSPHMPPFAFRQTRGYEAVAIAARKCWSSEKQAAKASLLSIMQ